jgi:asparagine synthase (glutamine-hydrolysing)
MCGIIGIVSENALTRADEIKKGTDAMIHRGPDGGGMKLFENCILGHRRLSIVDLSAGHQPMMSNDNKKAVVFNGEIYGFKEIKSNLQSYNFHTQSDTEVILALYEQYGSQLFSQLPGMFSLAIWDDEKNELICGRDRFGEKPFYYAITPSNEFVFASEIKAIIATGLIQPKIDPDSLHHYLKHLYVNPLTSIYSNIKVLPPAHFLVFKNGITEIKPYWKLPATNHQIKFHEAKELFTHLLKESVKKQMIADVPIGGFLSGGIDSSLIVAIASNYSSQPFTTLSFGFGDSINELPYAAEIAKKFKTNHIEINQELSMLSDLIMEMQDIFDEPFADSSNIPTYLVAKQAKKYLTVALTGDGGDEMLGGYAHWYRNLVGFEHSNKLDRNQHIYYRYMNKLAHRLGSNKYNAKLAQDYLIKAGLNTVKDIHSKQNMYFSDFEISKILKFQNCEKIENNYSFFFENTLNDAIKMDISDYMPGDILVKIDRASMANSLELRSPFLDKDLAEFCLSLPYQFKVNHYKDKLLARSAFSNILPQKILRRKKQGFGAPIEVWLNQPSIKEMVQVYLKDKNMCIFQYVNFDETQKYLESNSYKKWILLILSVWLEKNKITR